ncbi:hypothetical protein POJ06DRAFT_257209 [Lipomyces tetrasporus]|uniref:Uncharacterized protein n=1 Tax=Lipomyces tetrasporus TaxID=54092 RepID=A0AAD7QND0_9ASCO|nr:uncharacterized protein POJ06DRAFT_257209 [Lipomyces tetrasporus]KAJ8098495.1 hypothetical protein POJ06DRAFT_257209 [Lipomyces tetrasporus]
MGTVPCPMQRDLPGYMDTPLNTTYAETYFREWKSRTPMGRLGHPEELAGCALWLASDASSFCTGSDVLIDSSTPFCK